MNKAFVFTGIVGVGIFLTGCTNSFAVGNPTTHHATSLDKRAILMPAWFLRDLQITERANPIVGANYILNYGETNVYTDPQMNRVWYGSLSNYGKNTAFGYSWASVYQQAKTQTIKPLTSINVLEQTKQGGATVGRLVPAKSVGIANADYVAFANGQAIIATNKSGEVYYSVYPIKGVSVPWQN